MTGSKRRFMLVIAGALALVGSNVPSNAQDVLAACAPDVKKYCSNVTVGNGRLLACLYGHEDKISDSCDAAVAETADQLDWFLSNLRVALEKCAPDINKHCANVEAGQGRIYACLKLKTTEIGNECKAVVEEVSKRLTE